MKMELDAKALADMAVSIINAAGVHPWGALIVGTVALGAFALWVWSKK